MKASLQSHKGSNMQINVSVKDFDGQLCLEAAVSPTPGAAVTHIARTGWPVDVDHRALAVSELLRHIYRGIKDGTVPIGDL